MTIPNENESELPAEEIGESSPAYQKVEALFDLLRSPANAVAAQTDDALAPGKVLGEFTILRALASGGMGHVYLARQESLGRTVALKVCKPEIARDPRMKSRFLAEALALAQLTHPNVVPVLTSGEDQGCLYLAMEYVAGPSLAEVLQAIRDASPDSLASQVVSRVLTDPDGNSKGAAPAEGHAKLDRAYQTWIAQMLQQVAQGLAAAHAAGILHRDIKPANIVFAANGVPKIVDFGLARTSRAPSTTVAGEFYGTPAYTSPEQARGDVDEVSPASDVFSFGVTLFECLSLDRPFPGRTSADVLSAVLNSDAPLLRRVEKRTPWELEAIADKCLRKSPTERYPSGGALAEDLRNYLELRPVLARPISRIGRIARMIRRRPWVAASLFVLALSTAIGLFFANQAWEEYNAEKTRFAQSELDRAKRAAQELEAERIKTVARLVDEGDVALFRCLAGQRPTWLPAVIEQHRARGVAVYTEALNLDPDAVRPLVQRARLYASKDETLRLALVDLCKAQQLKPAYGSIRKFRGFVLEAMGRKEEGQAAREEAKRLYPTAPEDLYWLGVIAHSKEDDFTASYAHFSQALLLAPNDYWSRLERAYFGRIPSEVYVLHRVIPDLEIAKTIRPDLPFASEHLVRAYSSDRLQGNDPQRQKRELTDQIERFGLDILRAHQMSTILQKDKKYDEALAILHKVLDEDTGGHTAEQIGDLEYRMGHFEQARVWYTRAISEGTKYPVAYTRLADVCTAVKDWKGAESAYLDGIAENPKRPLLYDLLALWYWQRGRLNDAENTLRKGCELPCEFPSPNPFAAESSGQVREIAGCVQSLANLVGQSGRNDERLQVLERGISKLEKVLTTPIQAVKESAEEHVLKLKYDLGRAYLSVGRSNEAIALIDNELKKKPFHPINAKGLMDLQRILRGEQATLEVARLAEFSALHGPASNDRSSRQLAAAMVSSQLRKMGLLKELRDRLETSRAVGEALRTIDYRWLGTAIYQGEEAVGVLAEGISKFPESFDLHSDFMEVLQKVGRKDEAWNAYEKSRDLYFDLVSASEIPTAPGEGIKIPPMPPNFAAFPWYSFLLREGKNDEFRRLENRLKEACAKTSTDPKLLFIPRAFAEFGARKYAAAAESFETCVNQKLWNESASETMINVALARSRREIGHRQEAIKAYARALKISGVDPSWLTEYLTVVVEEQGVDGLSKALPPANTWSRLNVRSNATLNCFASWAALAKGAEKAAFEKLVYSTPYLDLAIGQPMYGVDEGLVCGVIQQVVAEKLGQSRYLSMATGFLKRFPAERVASMRKVFSLPERE